MPWGRELLSVVVALSGIAWALRIASDWFAERVGPQRGVVVLGGILFAAWLVAAVSSPPSWRGGLLGSLGLIQPERDPYSLPPAGSRRPLQSLEHPDESIDSVAPLVDLLKAPAEPNPAEPVSPAPPVDGRRGTTVATLSVSSARTVAGEGIVLVASVKGDGRPVRGEVSFLVGDQVVAKQPLRVQGLASQAEYRLVGLGPGLHAFRVSYSGSRTFDGSRSDPVSHRVVAR